MAKKFVVALAGCGIVGTAVAEKLLRDREYYRQKTGCDIELRYILARTFKKAREAGLPEKLFQTDFNKILEDRELSFVVELIGGTTFAREVIERSIQAGKSVVTANKALIATFGPELMKQARDKDLSISFEASCAGGIPIIRALQDGLLANRIEALYGIVNGTCNYILTSMIQHDQTYSQALKEAQYNGFAEADPTFDVAGTDSAHKLAILGSLAFGNSISFDQIPVKGIDTLDSMDVSFGKELGYVVKLLAVAQNFQEGISLRVRPAFISTGHPLAWVSGPFNAISVYGDPVGHTMYYGRGAGGYPTASSVIADILSLALGINGIMFSKLSLWPDQTKKVNQLPLDKIEGRYYIRTMVKDKPGVFAALASVLGNHKISISSALQKEAPIPDDTTRAVPIIITTHTVSEGNLQRALKEIDLLDCVTQNSVCIEILDEFQEKGY